ncbi:hypothetical protein PIROE2DRAFT_58800 [Piromyces sp. E2]|nr:hypothetical protein PIROE2DRAFT_58800 [Piromyces sp. E2]|eukprot:OUM67417.1 hypothetical protein PIROE2DRAFT_58800 [Piromyces sp. E2]
MNYELLYKVNRYLQNKKKIIVERDKDIRSSKSIRSSGKPGMASNIIRTSWNGESNGMSRKNSQSDDIRSEHSYNIRRNVSNLIKTTYDMEMNKIPSQDLDHHSGSQQLSHNHSETINKYQNFDDLKETYHLGKRAQLLKRYILDINQGTNLYISSDFLSIRGDNFPINFHKVFKPAYDKLYQLFMDINAPALINIKQNTINNIKERLDKGDYSYDMYMDVCI